MTAALFTLAGIVIGVVLTLVDALDDAWDALAVALA
jgi:Flp pilus assembly pilin Flp